MPRILLVALTMVIASLPGRAQSASPDEALMDSLAVILQQMRVLQEEQSGLTARMAGLAAGLSQVRAELQRLAGLIETGPPAVRGDQVEAELFDAGPTAGRAPAASAIGKTIDTGEGHALGSPEAPVTIVEFSDFQCPFCRRHNATVLPTLKARYVDTGRVRYVFRHYPLGFHPLAPGAAEAALCAGEQDRFWEMHDLLFEGSAALNPDRFPDFAATLQLDGPRFAACLESDRHLQTVQADAEAAESLGVGGTPYFLLGRSESGRMTVERIVNGARGLEDFESAIEALLAGR